MLLCMKCSPWIMLSDYFIMFSFHRFTHGRCDLGQLFVPAVTPADGAHHIFRCFSQASLWVPSPEHTSTVRHAKEVRAPGNLSCGQGTANAQCQMMIVFMQMLHPLNSLFPLSLSVALPPCHCFLSPSKPLV